MNPQDVSAVSSTDAWAVGATNGGNETAIAHWDGATWNMVPSPNPGTTRLAGLSGVSAVSGAGAWAVGSYYDASSSSPCYDYSCTLIEHSDGSGWSVAPSPNVDSASNFLYDVSADSGSDAWAVGSVDLGLSGERTLIEHWVGGAWTIVPSPSPGDSASLSGVSVVSGNNAWAVGTFSTINSGGTASYALIEHWDGSGWNVVDSPDPVTKHLFDVSAVTGSDVWAVGDTYLTGDQAYSRTLIEHWDGSNWSVVDSPDPAGDNNDGDYLHAVSAVSARDVWAVGYAHFAIDHSYRTLIAHWNGRYWTSVTSPSPGRSAGLVGISAVSSTDAWSVGGAYYGALILHWNGTSWGIVGAPPSAAETLGGTYPGAPHTTCSSSQPVNCVTGEFWHRFDDLTIPGRGVPLDLARTYSSANATVLGPLGYGWTDSYNWSLTLDAASPGDVTVHSSSGASLTFNPDGSGGFLPSSPVKATLVKNADGSFTYNQNDGITYGFDASGRLLTQTDRNGYTTTLSYSGGQLHQVSDPAERTLTFAYGDNGLISSVTDDAGGRQVQYFYDSANELTRVTDVVGNESHFDYYPGHLMKTMTDANNGRTSNVYDSYGRVTSQTDPAQRTTTWCYAAPSSCPSSPAPTETGTTTVTDAAGNTTVYRYESDVVTSRTQGYGSPQAASWTYTYEPVTLQIASVTDPNGHTSSSIYDASGNLLTHTDALGRTTTYTFNGLNEVTSVTDPLKVTTRYDYDVAGNLQRVSTPLSSTRAVTTVYSYSDVAHPGDVTAMTDPNGRPWNYAYDQYGDIASVEDPLGHTTTFAYDSDGRMLTKTAPRGNAPGANPASFTSTYIYDPFGDLRKVIDPLGNTTVNRYDPNRNLVFVKDPDANTTTYTYNGDDEVTDAVHADPSGAVVQELKSAYDDAGNLYRQVDGEGNPIIYRYDPLNHLSSVTDGLGRITSYAYDGVGNLKSLKDPQGQTTTFVYNPADHLKAITYSSGTPSKVSFAYNADGERTTMTDGSGVSTYAYDHVRRLVSSSHTPPGGTKKLVRYAYDLNSNLTTITYPPGTRVLRHFDQANELISVQDWKGNLTRFAYDPDGNLRTESYPSGVVATFGHDDADRISSITDKLESGTLLDLPYSIDPAGLVSAEGPQGYGYDALDRLTSATGPVTSAYGYDRADELTSIAPSGKTPQDLSYDAANQLASLTQGSTVTSYSFNAEGDRVKTSSSAGSSSTYSFDQANHLTGFSSGSKSATYTYDGNGLRMMKTVGVTTSSYVWDLADPVPLVLADGATSYVYGPRGIPLEQVDASGEVLYYHQDQLGSTRLLTDPSGTVVASYRYDPYGSPRRLGGLVSTRMGFAGQYRDPETGLTYLRARYYDPTTGQFLSRDPLTFQTRQPYAYAGNSPTNATDVTGLTYQDCLKTAPWPFLCDAAVGALHINANYIAPSVAPIAPWVDRAAVYCSATEFFRVLGCGDVTGLADTYVHLSLYFAGCEAMPTVEDVQQQFISLGLGQTVPRLGNAYDFTTGVVGLATSQQPSCPCRTWSFNGSTFGPT